ncbi:hypothetical protein J1C67_11480 [Clostridium gasigenes]|uniref:hypothetical protein n=1 Tax=Clostridium gasigenes TaxID=94869 RepID=UPI001A92A7CD|nr:hypothetical protein [Clostridium gasigenes]QSW18189.1 hypothetical protein J1C67_11480 [Clostridium gasigenes]
MKSNIKIKDILKNKINLIFIPIIFSQIYFLQGSIGIVKEPVNIYISGLYTMYERALFVIVFLLINYLIICEFDKNMIILRYKSSELWVKDIYEKIIKKTVKTILILNSFPLIFAISQSNLTTKDCAILIMYVVNQIASFSILVYIYILVFALTHNKIYVFWGIFISLYLPKILLDFFKNGYITPINMIFLNPNISIGNMLLQTNIIVVICGITVYLIQNNFLKDKYKDIIWRF